MKPDSVKGYTIGDNTHKERSRHPWRMDDEKVTYPGYERFVKAGLKNVCVHKGLFPESTAARWPHLLEYAKVGDVGKAAKDWPQLNFVIYHGGYRQVGGDPVGNAGEAWTSSADRPHRVGERPGRHPGAVRRHQRLCRRRPAVRPDRGGGAAAGRGVMGTLVKGLGADHVVWGTDAVWTGSPQWQIEGLRRLEIPEDMQKKYGFAPLGAADGPVKRAIFGDNTAKHYKLDPRKRSDIGPGKDRFARMKDRIRTERARALEPALRLRARSGRLVGIRLSGPGSEIAPRISGGFVLSPARSRAPSRRSGGQRQGGSCACAPSLGYLRDDVPAPWPGRARRHWPASSSRTGSCFPGTRCSPRCRARCRCPDMQRPAHARPIRRTPARQ